MLEPSQQKQVAISTSSHSFFLRKEVQVMDPQTAQLILKLGIFFPTETPSTITKLATYKQLSELMTFFDMPKEKERTKQHMVIELQKHLQKT